jgi:RND family efflux transporter MFP subunit
MRRLAGESINRAAGITFALGVQHWRPSMNTRIILAAHIAVAALSCSMLPACSHSPAPPERRPTPVKVRVVEEPSSVQLARFSGAIEPELRVDMAFRVGGYVDALGQIEVAGKKARALEKGDLVHKGTILARVRASDYEQKLATARASLNEARAQAKLADAELERARKLYASKAISKAEFDTQIARAETTHAMVDGALAQSREAAIALDDTLLRAPLDGIVLWRQVEVGTLVSPGQPALAIADTRSVNAVFGVPQELVQKLHIGAPVTVFVAAEGDSAAPEQALQANVTNIAPSADASGRLFAIKALLPNPSNVLRPGAVVSVHVPEATLGVAAIEIPLSAIVRNPARPRGYSVFVLDGDDQHATARLRDVELGEVLGNSVTVEGGLALGERVVTVGTTLLRDRADAVVIP